MSNDNTENKAAFDEILKKVGSENLTAPSELDWDNMDIELPIKNSKRRFVFGILVGLFLFLGLSIYMYVSSTPAQIEYANNDEIVLSDVQIEQDIKKVIKTKETGTAISIESKSEIENKASALVQNISIQTNPSTQIKQKSSNVVKPIQAEQNTPPILIQANEATQPNQVVQKVIKTQDAQKTEHYSNKDLSRESKKHLSTMENIPLNTNQVFKIEQRLFETKMIIVTANKEAFIPSINQEINTSSGWTFFLGTNLMANNFKSSNDDYQTSLKSITGTSWGQSVSVDKFIPISKSYFGTIGVSYYRFFHTYENRKELPFIDATNSLGQRERTRRTLVTKHHNHQDIISLSLGAGKTFDLSKKLNVKLLANINPGYKLHEKGRFINASATEVDISDLSKKSFNISADLGGFLEYQFSKFSVLGGASYNQFLSNNISLDEINVKSKSRGLTLSIGTSIKF